jgi:hypothetical protein
MASPAAIDVHDMRALRSTGCRNHIVRVGAGLSTAGFVQELVYDVTMVRSRVDRRMVPADLMMTRAATPPVQPHWRRVAQLRTTGGTQVVSALGEMLDD